MNYLDELKKYKNNFVQTAQNVGNAVQSGVKELYNTGQQAVQNVQNAVKGNAQPEYDMAAQYDNYKAEQQAQRAATQQAQQQAQPTATPQASQQQTGQQTQSQWQSQLDNIMNQIMNREKFSYDMNGDALYQQYADIYQNQANLGMQNAMAQNAALTGGYGSSYSQMAGQQAYAQQMQGLNEAGMDLYDRALNQYLAEGDQLNDRYAMLAAREEQAYNRGLDERNYQYQLDRDAVSDAQWKESMDYQANRDAVSDAQWKAELDRYLANDKLAAEQWQAGMDRQAEEFDKLYGENGFYTKQNAADNKYRDDSLKQDQKQFDALYGEKGYYASEAQKDRNFQESMSNTEYDRMYGENGFYTKQNEADNEYRDATLKQSQDEFNSLYGYTDENGVYHKGYYEIESEKDKQFQSDMADKEYDRMYGENGYYTNRDKIEDEQWEKSFNASYGDGTKTGSSTVYEGGGALDGQEVPNILANVEGLTTDDTSFFDSNGKFMVAEYTGTDKDGNMIYRYNGKNVTVDKGTNPYTRTENTDIEYGTFGNGYQPNNVASYYGDAEMGKLTETGITDRVNGIVQNVYKDATGKTWIWDDTKNEYMEYGLYAETGGDGPVNQKPLLDKFNTRN